MKKFLCILLTLVLLLAACGCQSTPAETTVPETTQPPTETIPPETVPPTTIVTEPPTEPTEVVLDESWFDDALFIGESRTMGLKLWGRLGNADYFCAESLTVYGVLGIEASDYGFESQRLSSLLSSQSYGKVYIHLGINEVGGNLDKFAAQYQTINDRIRQLAEEQGLLFSDVNQLVADENGYLNMELSFDGCHLHEAGYEAWAQWLLEEAATFDIP